MKSCNLIYLLLFMITSCRIIDEKNNNACFSCAVSGKESSCQMTDYCALFSSKSDSTALLNFDRCGAGVLQSVQFNFTNITTADSAFVKVLTDSSAVYLFPITPTGNGDASAAPSKKETQDAMSISNAITFNKGCTVSFILHAAATKKAITNPASLRHIFILWSATNKSSGESSTNAVMEKE